MSVRKVLVIYVISIIFLQQSLCGQFHLRREPFQLSHQGPFFYGRSQSSNNIGGGIAGFIFGPILFILSFICIWNNEKKAAIDHRRVSLAKTQVRQVDPSNISQIKQNDGQLVHVSGRTQVNQPLYDNQTGLSFNNAIKVKREVEVRQYRSIGSNRDNNDRRYQLRWVSSNEQNAGDGYSNDPINWFIKSEVTKNKNVTLANYILSQSLIDQLSYQDVYKPSTQDAYNIGRNFTGRVRNQPFVNQQYMYFPKMSGSSDAHGTLRIRYQICRPGDTSIISQSQRNSFTPYRIDIKQNGKADEDEQFGNCCCLLSNCTAHLFSPLREIDFISQKMQSSDQMIQEYKKGIHCKKNFIRFACYMLMVLSICAFFSPITTILGYIPLLGGFLKGVVGLAIFLAAVIVSLPLFILAVSVSWLRFHPKIGLLIFGVGLLIAGIVIALIIVNKPKDSQNVHTITHQYLRIF